MNQESYLLMSIILTFLFLKGINVDYLYKLVEYFQNIHNYYDQWFNTLDNIQDILDIEETIDDTKQEIPYEEKYLKEIANMSKEYILDESETELKKIKFVEYYNIIINKYDEIINGIQIEIIQLNNKLNKCTSNLNQEQNEYNYSDDDSDDENSIYDKITKLQRYTLNMNYNIILNYKQILKHLMLTKII